MLSGVNNMLEKIKEKPTVAHCPCIENPPSLHLTSISLALSLILRLCFHWRFQDREGLEAWSSENRPGSSTANAQNTATSSRSRSHAACRRSVGLHFARTLLPLHTSSECHPRAHSEKASAKQFIEALPLRQRAAKTQCSCPGLGAHHVGSTS